MVAKGLLLDLPHLPSGIDTLERLHPGGETKTHISVNDLLCEGFIFTCWLPAEGHSNEMYITNPLFEGCVALFFDFLSSARVLFLCFKRGFYDIDTKARPRSVFPLRST